ARTPMAQRISGLPCGRTASSSSRATRSTPCPAATPCRCVRSSSPTTFSRPSASSPAAASSYRRCAPTPGSRATRWAAVRAASAAPQTSAAAVPAIPPPPPELPAAPSPGGGKFAWPVRGPVLVGYGPGANGTQNDGINIAAPLGTPVLAAGDGVVAYAGNELRG